MENEVSTAISFHDIKYIVTVAVHQQQLSVQVEYEDSHNTLSSSSNSYPNALSTPCWIGHFSSNCKNCYTSMSLCYKVISIIDIQDLTRKTGNFKRFGVFANMLISAVQRRSEAVFIDLFTTADLVHPLFFPDSQFSRPKSVL